MYQAIATSQDKKDKLLYLDNAYNIEFGNRINCGCHLYQNGELHTAGNWLNHASDLLHHASNLPNCAIDLLT